MKCEYLDCENVALSKRAISINNNPKIVLSLCEIHLDAADEDEEQQRRDEKHGLYGDK